MSRLGLVARNGATYYKGELNECREFLTEHGMECHDTDNWRGIVNGVERAGLIFFELGWVAAYWGPDFL